MTLDGFQKDQAVFNLWANTRIISWLKPQSPELLAQELSSSFSSIRLTLLHIWDAEEVWLDRLQGKIPAEALHEDYVGPIAPVFEGLLSNSTALAAYIHTLSHDDLMEVCHFQKMDGSPDSRPRFEMIHHCLNHSTYHRGQIVTMARTLGMTDPPTTDFMPYVRSK